MTTITFKTAHKEKIMEFKNCSSKGFSLVELMIVVAIVAILAAVAVPAYFNHILRSRQADAYHNLLDIKAAQEMFLSMENSYAGPYSPLPIAGNTFTNLLSFNYADTTYYSYHIYPVLQPRHSLPGPLANSKN